MGKYIVRMYLTQQWVLKKQSNILGWNNPIILNELAKINKNPFLLNIVNTPHKG